MKTILTFSLFTFTFSLLSAFGGADDTLITFSTKGPDTYLDGTVVKDGECYALVWTKSGATFAGFTADGNPVGDGSEVLVFAPLAKDGRCPSTLFELDAKLAERYKGGTYALYLVDTRLASGKLGGVKADGLPVAVNGYGEVKSKSEEVKSAEGASSQASVSVTTKSALPADAPKPQITAIRLVGDKVFLTVKNTLPCLQYAANEVKVRGEGGQRRDGKSSDNLNLQPQSGSATQGAENVDEEITVIAPKKGESGFYSVERN